MKCPFCGNVHVAYKCFTGDIPAPRVGDFVVCADCAWISRVQSEGTLRLIKDSDWDDMSPRLLSMINTTRDRVMNVRMEELCQKHT